MFVQAARELSKTIAKHGSILRSMDWIFCTVR